MKFYSSGGNKKMEENFTMYDIADRLGWKYIQKQKGYIKCPFPECGTEKLACNITDKYFSCLKCGNKGNYYTIYARLYGIQGRDGLSSTQIAARELRKMFGNGYVSRSLKEAEIIGKEEVEKRPVEELDKAYCELIRNTSLSNIHKKALIERGLTEKQIEAYGFRSVDNTRSGAICRILQKNGINLSRIPGFYNDTFNNEWRLNTWSMEGYFCICPDENGLIQGFQIRLDKPKNGQKYLWLSSKDKVEGVSSGSPSAYFGNRKATKIVVVDGILKACVCNCFNRDKNTAFVGVAGVSNYKNMRAMIERLKKRGITHVYNAYDMDEFTNPICDENYKDKCKTCKHNGDLIKCVCEDKKRKIKALTDGSMKLENTVKELNLTYARLTWDIGEDNFWNGKIKGLDDYLLLLKERRDSNEINEI
jgi:hypothetical protein